MPTVPRRVSLVLPYVSRTQFYMGLREVDDLSLKWSLIGGHLKDGEDPQIGALRELTEESRLSPNPSTWVQIGQWSNPIDLTVIYLFSVQVTGEPDASRDPDREFKKFKLVDFSGGVPLDLLPYIHGPKDSKNNVLVKVFGLQTMKSEDEERSDEENDEEEVPQPATLLESLEEQGYTLLYYSRPVPEIAILCNGVKIGSVIGTTKTKNKIDTHADVAPEHQGKGLGLEGHKALLRSWLADKDYGTKKSVLMQHKLRSL